MMHLAIEPKAVWRLLRVTGLLTGLGFMAWVFAQVLADPRFHKDQFFAIGFVEAIGVGIIANAAIAIAFGDMVGKYAPDVATRKRITAFYYAQVAKYIPGRIAALMVQRSVLSGPHATTATLASNLELTAISCWLCGGAAAALLVWPYSKAGATILTIAAVAIGAGLMMVDWWRVLSPLMSKLGKGRGINASIRALREASTLRATILSSAMLVLPVISSYLLLVNGMGTDHGAALQLSAMLLLSWIGGLLAFIFPAGIGIREFIFFALGGALAHSPEPALMAAIALASRIVQILIDITGVLLFVAYDRLIRYRGMHEKQ
jgi:hypothetical protein